VDKAAKRTRMQRPAPRRGNDRRRAPGLARPAGRAPL